jgi:hypothetical protein
MLIKPARSFLAISLLVVQVSACANSASWVRKYTYPPNFYYITDEQLRSTMWQLAYHSRELRELMASQERAAARRAEVLQHLQLMEQATIALNRTGWPTNHPMIDANRASFLRDIRAAGEAIIREPPNYLIAGSVSGACVYCHGSRQTAR